MKHVGLSISRILVIIMCFFAHVPWYLILMYGVYVIVTEISDAEERRKVKEYQDYINRHL